MSDGLVCRRAHQHDLPALLTLYGALSANNPALDSHLAETRLAEMLAMPQLYLGIGEADGESVTTATLLLVPNLTRGARPYGLIENVVTLARCRGRGYARGMLTHLVGRARQADAYKVMLMTGRKDEETLRFYERSGFTRGSKTAFEMRL